VYLFWTSLVFAPCEETAGYIMKVLALQTVGNACRVKAAIKSFGGMLDEH
jgi:hypothetical protein